MTRHRLTVLVVLLAVPTALVVGSWGVYYWRHRHENWFLDDPDVRVRWPAAFLVSKLSPPTDVWEKARHITMSDVKQYWAVRFDDRK